MVGAKQLKTQDYPGSGRGPYVQQRCARGTVLLCTGVPVVGRLQAKRERRRGLQVPSEEIGDVVGELRKLRMKWLQVFVCRCPYVHVHLRQGGSSSFYRPRRG
jgi:hypothetical protein